MAARFFRESMAISAAYGDRRGIAIAQSNLGDVAAARGKGEDAADDYEQSLAMYREIYNLIGIVETLVKLGDLARAAGDTAVTRRHYANACRTAEELRLSPDAHSRLIGAAETWLQKADDA